MKRVLKLRKKYIVLFVILFLVVCGGLFLSKDRALKGKVDIHKLLETEDYAYLPSSAKFYIQRMYKETGTVVLTEKNKKPGVPYLNPKYVEYLEASPEEKEKYSLIPTNIVVDYKYNNKIYKNVINPNLPSKYDLRDDGYVGAVKNQGMLDLCWAFSANSQLESLLLKNGITASFSERQLDYATSSNGINNYVSEYNMDKRRLGSGGNYVGAIVPMMNGVGTVSSASFPYNADNFDKKELYEVLNFANSQYEVNGGINMPSTDITDYIDVIKTYVMEYGGTFVGTSAPTYGCSHYDEDNDTYLIRNDGVCADAPHGMHIIGWDDDYEYSYCANGNTHEPLTASCSAENTVTGKGAWLVKNSWGDGQPYTYVYVAYDSYDTAVSLVTDVAPISEKTWDNVYSYGEDTRGYFQNYTIAYDGFRSSKFGNFNEKIEKVKFITLTENASFKVTIKFEDESKPSGYAEYEKTINTTLPGLQTVDFSDLNIVADADTIEVIVSETDIMDDNYFALPFYLYTSNVDNDVHIKTDDVTYSNTLDTQNGDDYKVAVYSVTKNLPSNAEVDYKLYSDEETEIPITYANNYVAENNVLTTITIPSNVGLGVYTLKTLYNEVVYATSDVYLNVEVAAIEGSGTVADPYLIKTPADLLIINDNMEASYALANDLDFEGEAIEPIGLASGRGFTGTFDGRGHTIKNLYINGANSSNSYQYAGLFAGITSNNQNPVIVKDIVLDNIRSYTDYYSLIQGDAGILAGIVSDCDDDYYCGLNDVIISDIVLTGNSAVETGLIGTVFVSKEHGVSFNNIYIDTVAEYHRGLNGTLISYLERIYDTDGSILAKNIQNMSLYKYYSYDYGYNQYDLYNGYYINR